MVVHRMLGTAQCLTNLTAEVLGETRTTNILDLCSGSGGPMPEVLHNLRERSQFEGAHLTLSDLYPDLKAANKFNRGDDHVAYRTKPLDAADPDAAFKGLRTMVSSFHHMSPKLARNILESAKNDGQPILIYEISDNSYPKWLWWLSIPTTFIMCLFITPFVRPMTWQQLLFTYLIPIIPLTFAWDGAVSNARTYSLNDLDVLLGGLQDGSYSWEKNVIKGKNRSLYLIGKPR